MSLASPIGQGLLGAAEGEEVSIELPRGERRYKVLELSTLPQQLESTLSNLDTWVADLRTQLAA